MRLERLSIELYLIRETTKIACHFVKILVMIVGYFVLLLLYKSKEADAEGIVLKLADKFTEICR